MGQAAPAQAAQNASEAPQWAPAPTTPPMWLPFDDAQLLATPDPFAVPGVWRVVVPQGLGLMAQSAQGSAQPAPDGIIFRRGQLVVVTHLSPGGGWARVFLGPDYASSTCWVPASASTLLPPYRCGASFALSQAMRRLRNATDPQVCAREAVLAIREVDSALQRGEVVSAIAQLDSTRPRLQTDYLETRNPYRTVFILQCGAVLLDALELKSQGVKDAVEQFRKKQCVDVSRCSRPSLRFLVAELMHKARIPYRGRPSPRPKRRRFVV
eukprot:TRINITY_DN32747_c0_g1_i1.p1 TRINITY_DN32747_c0_g1~~TRINITY_DN32747_c0_g1_i1.p1  ORF type:complete len:268 (+),score=34.13 TRINITY_DN32747_c0_g1_i1:80-883(+)